METVGQKIKRNLKEGTFLKNAPIALRNRLVKQFQTSNLFYSFDKYRVQTKKYQEDIPGLGNHGRVYGNYYLDSRVPLDATSVIYSLGILTDISFDKAVSEAHQVGVYMYDPTPKSIAFMEGHADNPYFHFHPYGVWTENCTLKFYEPKLGGSASLINTEASGNFFEATCLTMKDILHQNKHDHISVFKADIEGAALPILLQMIEQSILPDQIVVEFERPRKDDQKVEQFFEDLNRLRAQLKTHQYEEYLLPRQEAKYFSLEMLFVHKNALEHAGN